MFSDQEHRAVRLPRLLRRPRVDPVGLGRELGTRPDSDLDRDQGQTGRREQPQLRSQLLQGWRLR